MSTKVWGPDEVHLKVFGRGTRVQFKRNVTVSTPMPNGVMGKSVIEAGEKGTIQSIFPYRVIHLDNGREISLHISISLTDELEILPDGKKLRLVK